MKTSISVLVIDNNESLTNDIKKYFSNHEVIKVVACCKDGEEGLSYIINNSNSIDVVVMDLILPKLDGLFVLQELSKRGINKNIIVTTSFRDENVMEEANSYGVDYYMLKPVNFIKKKKRILSVNLKKNSNKLFNQEAIVADMLHRLGIPSHIRGYQYIKEGIMIVYKGGNKISYITKDVYPEIAKRYDTTPTRVERAIRHAIEISWSRGDMGLMEETFGNSLNVNRDKPTNAEYLTTLADKIRINQNLIMN